MLSFTSSIGVVKHTALWLTSSFTDQKLTRSTEKKTEAVSNTNSIAIYCIHGTFDRSSSFSQIAERIKDNLPAEISAIHLISFEGRGQLNGIEHFAKQLKDKIILNGDKRVIFMGHSRGCLVTSFVTEYLAKENNIDVLASIHVCGPFRGTHWAFAPLTASESVSQMRIGSPFLEELTEKMKSSGNTHYYFSASNDALVSPTQAFLDEHKQNTVELDKHGHLSIMWSGRLANHIQDIVKKTVLQTTAKPDDKPVATLAPIEMTRKISL